MARKLLACSRGSFLTSSFRISGCLLRNGGGLLLLERIRNARIHVPVIILSGEGTQTETIKAMRLGAKDYVVKENIKEELLPNVSQLLEKVRSKWRRMSLELSRLR